MGLLTSANHKRDILREAALVHMPDEMRHIFAYLIIYFDISEAHVLFREFVAHLNEDFFAQTNDVQLATRLCLIRICEILHINGYDYNQFVNESINFEELRAYYQVVHEGVPDARYIASLNIEQRRIFDNLAEAIENPSSSNLFYIDGPRGSGKTFLYSALTAYCLQRDVRFICVAFSGIASSLLYKGCTVHSAFAIPLNTREGSRSYLRMNSSKASYLRSLSVIIWDEISITSKHIIDAADDLFRQLMENNHPFGGKIVIFGGDFRQVLPVVFHGTRALIMEVIAKKAECWPNVTKFELTTNVRASEDPNFTEWVLSFGNGTALETMVDGVPKIEIIDSIRMSENMIGELFGNYNQEIVSDEFAASSKVILCATNEDVRKINALIIESLPGEKVTSFSHTYIESMDLSEIEAFNSDYLNSLNVAGLPSHELRLAVGSPILLLRNLNASQGLCNGTRLIVQQVTQNLIKSKISFGRRRGAVVLIPKIKLTYEGLELPFKLCRVQFPVCLAFAMTINKAQGQTYNKVGLCFHQLGIERLKSHWYCLHRPYSDAHSPTHSHRSIV